MKIHVLGYYDRLNVGDEAFRPTINHFFLGHDVEFYNIDNYRQQPPPTPDVLVLGGGDVVTPYYLPVASKINCKKIALGVGLGYESESDLAAEAGFDAWFLRNQNDVKLLGSKTKASVEYTPDLAFHLQPSGRKVLHRYHTGDQPVVAVLLTDYLMPSSTRSGDLFWNRARAFLEDFGPFCKKLESEGFRVLAVPCSTDQHADDRRIHMSVRAFADPKMICVHDFLQPQEMVDLLSEVKFSICQRFHSHVFSMIAGKPILSIGFTRKVQKLIMASGAGVDANCFKKDGYVKTDLWSAFCKMQQEASAMSTHFLQFAALNRNELSNVKQKVLQLIH